MIYVECFPDFTLINTLGFSRREIVHAGSKGKVCNRLRKTYNSKGVIDEDPLAHQPS